jgi:hypothetical protein
MQLILRSKLLSLIVLQCTFWLSGMAFAASLNWRSASHAEVVSVLSAFNEENEPRNLPAIEAAIEEMKRRVEAGDIAYLDLLLAFTEAKVVAEQVQQSSAGRSTAGTALSIAENSDVSALRQQLRAALAQYPNEPRLLRAAINRQMWLSDHEWQQWHERYVALVPSAWDVRLALLKSAAGRGQFEQARLGAIELFRQGSLDSESQLIILTELGQILSTEGSGCTDLGAQFLTFADQAGNAGASAVSAETLLQGLQAARCASGSE